VAEITNSETRYSTYIHLKDAPYSSQEGLMSPPPASEISCLTLW